MDSMNYESCEWSHQRYHNFATVSILPATLLIVALVLFLSLVEKEVTIRATGTLTSETVIQRVQATTNEKIQTNYLEENKVVHKGETLLAYDWSTEALLTEQTSDDVAQLDQQLTELRLFYESVEQGENRLGDTDTYGYAHQYEEYRQQQSLIQSAIARENQDIATKNQASQQLSTHLLEQRHQALEELEQLESYQRALTKEETLEPTHPYYEEWHRLDKTAYPAAAQQLRDRIQAQRQQVAAMDLQQDGITWQNENTTLVTQLAQLQATRLAQIKQEEASLQQKYSQLTHQQAAQDKQREQATILAEADGVLHINQTVTGMTTIPAGTVLAEVYPLLDEASSIVVSALVDSQYMGEIQEGQVAHFEAALTRARSLRLTGTVTTIDVATRQTEQGSGYLVKVTVPLTDENRRDVKYGMTGRVSFVTGRKTFLKDWVDRYLRGE